MRIVFMGTPDFAVPSLRALMEQKYNVVGVVTQPDRPKGRKRELTPPPVKVVAEEFGLPVLQPEKVRNPEELQQVLDLKPDLIVTAAFGQILPKQLIDAPKFGAINVHASLLPKYRGGAPIHHAIMNGEPELGVTIMYMVEALDAGDMLKQASIPLLPDDHVGTMFEKLSHLGAKVLLEVIPELITGSIQAVPQDSSQVTYSPNIKREDERIDWTKTAQMIEYHVRGLHPWPVAFTYWQGKPLKVWWAKATDIPAKKDPGVVQEITEQGILVAASDFCVRLFEIQPAGKKRIDVASFVRGRQMEVDERLGEINE